MYANLCRWRLQEHRDERDDRRYATKRKNGACRLNRTLRQQAPFEKNAVARLVRAFSFERPPPGVFLIFQFFVGMAENCKKLCRI